MRSAARPLTDESGTTVTVDETSFASVLETTIQGRVFGTSAPWAGSKLTQTKEPFTKMANLLCRLPQIRDRCAAIRDGRPYTRLKDEL